MNTFAPFSNTILQSKIQKINIGLLFNYYVFQRIYIFTFCLIFFGAVESLAQCVTGDCATHTVDVNLANIPVCGVGVGQFNDDADNNSDCEDSGGLNCVRYLFDRPVGSLTQQITMNVGQGLGCNGETDATYVLIDGVCSQLSDGGSQTVITFTFPIDQDQISIYLCVNSSGQTSICNVCNEPPPCTLEATCKDIDVTSTYCSTECNLPPIFTNPSDVFNNTSTCTETIRMLAPVETGETTCVDTNADDKINVTRTYLLEWFDDDYISGFDSNGDPIVTPTWFPLKECTQNIELVLGACCTQDATCIALPDIVASQCTVPAPLTDPASVFSGIEPCGAVVTMTADPDSDTDCTNGFNFTRTYRLFFDGVEIETCTQDINISLPTITCGMQPDLTLLACDEDPATTISAWKTGFSVSGGCTPYDGNIEPYTDPMSCDVATTITVTYSGTDACGQAFSCTADINVPGPPAKPIITHTNPLADYDLGCNPTSIETPNFIVMDECTSSTISYSDSGVVDGVGCEKSRTWTASYAGVCEAADPVIVTYTWKLASSVSLTPPTNATEGSCQTQASIDAAFATWLGTVSASGGCNLNVTNDNAGAPAACGGSATVTWTASSDCEGDVVESATFTVTAAPVVSLTPPEDKVIGPCRSNVYLNNQFNAWLALVEFEGGCSATIDDGDPIRPPRCGGSTIVTWTVSTACGDDVSMSSTFTVTPAPEVSLTAPEDEVIGSCQLQEDIDMAFEMWLEEVEFEGGCGTNLSNDNTGAPPACGGSTTVTWMVTSTCEVDVTESATFEVEPAPALVCITPTVDLDLSTSCDDPASAITAWESGFGFTGGCNASGSIQTYTAPTSCDEAGTITVEYIVTDNCGQNFSCNANIIIPEMPAITSCRKLFWNS